MTFVATFRRRCPITWCRRCLSCWRPCRCHPMAKSIAERFRLPKLDGLGQCKRMKPLALRRRKWWRISRQMFSLDRINVHDNFFELGGNSLLAARLVTRIEKEIGRSVDLATVFCAPTIATLACHLDTRPKTRRDLLETLQATGEKPAVVWVGSVGPVQPLREQVLPEHPYCWCKLRAPGRWTDPARYHRVSCQRVPA